MLTGLYLLGDPAGLRVRLGAQGEAEQGALKGSLDIAAKRPVGRELVWMLLGRRRRDEVDALAWVGRRDVRHPAAVGVKYDQRVPCMSSASLGGPWGVTCLISSGACTAYRDPVFF